MTQPFIDFATSRGLVIQHLSAGRWVRVPTVDHPRSRNGAYFLGDGYAHVQNWATQDKVETWFAEKTYAHDPTFLRRMEADRAKADAHRRELALRASQKAQELINQASPYTHGYLESKGFPAEKGLVLDQTLLIPMRDYRDGSLRGVQQIIMDGGDYTKKMLYGMRANGAIHQLGRAKLSVLCEGYATGLSIESAAKGMPVEVVVCFSANNLAFIAGRLDPHTTYVFADNDKSGTGQRVAAQTGLKWAMSDVEGEDANDLHRRAGRLALKGKLLDLLRSRP